jgi:hypothetical protein
MVLHLVFAIRAAPAACNGDTNDAVDRCRRFSNSSAPLYSPPRAGEERYQGKNRGSRLVIAGLVLRSRSDRSPDGVQRHPRRPNPDFAALNLGRLPLSEGMSLGFAHLQIRQLAGGDHRAGGQAGRRAAGRFERDGERGIRRDPAGEVGRDLESDRLTRLN